MNAVVTNNLGKRYEIFRRPLDRLGEWLTFGRARLHEDFWALKGIDLELKAGETLGILGPNGAGKSTLLKLLAGISRPSEGTMQLNGRVTGLLELGAGFHQEFTGRDNAIMNCSLLGMSRAETRRKLDEIVEFSEIGDFIDQPVKNYSSGMYMRLGFSVATCVDPDILLVDEALSVGDEYFLGKCADRFEKLRKEGKTIILVTHTVGELRLICDEALLLDGGRLLRRDKPDRIADEYLAMVAAKSEQRARAYNVREGRETTISDEVVFDEIEVLDKDGNEAVVLAPGAPFAVRAHYHVNRDIENILIGLYISRENGAKVITQFRAIDEMLEREWDSMQDLYPLMYNKKAGEQGTVTCHFDRMPLLIGGTFFISFWVVQPKERNLPRAFESPLRRYFTVMDPPAEFHAAFHTRAHWEDTGCGE